MAKPRSGVRHIASKRPASRGASPAKPISDQQARRIAREAYIYGVPMVTVYSTLYAFSIDKANPQYKGPFNSILNVARVFTPDDTAFVTPNSDTPYTFIGPDLRAEPMVLTVPAMEKNRYFVFQMMDLYTFNFDYVGSRATGNGGGDFLLAGPDWKGTKPKGIAKVIRCETQFVNVVGRTQLFNPDDLANVKKIQSGYKLRPLSEYLGQPAPPPAPALDWVKPMVPAQQSKSLEFFNQLGFLLQLTSVNPAEVTLRKRFEKIGIVPGKPFAARSLSGARKTALLKGMADGQKAIDAYRHKLGGKSAGLFGSRSFLKNNYLKRATGTQVGIGANSKDEALYPIYDKDSNGKPLDGTRGRYTLSYSGGKYPPVNAFWSLTMYALPSQLLVKNPIGRYLINSPMLPQLKRDPDGGLTIYIQNQSPGPDKQANWLPAPTGRFMMAARYYWPKRKLLDNSWKSPAVQPAKASAAAKGVSPIEGQAIAKDAYIYAYAMMESYQTWRSQAVDKTANGYVGGFNVFRHYSQPFTPDNTDIVTPNNDTPYSWAWLDLRAEPMVVSAPAVPRDRYYVMQWMDLFTQNFAYIGVRSTGFGAGSYLIAGPGWKGKKPAGISKVFKAETNIVGTLTRTALHGAEDVPNVKAIQAQYKLQPLSSFLRKAPPPPTSPIAFPPYDKAKARTHDFIGYLNFLLQFAEPPVQSETAIRKRFEKIGIVPGQAWDASKIDPAMLAAIDAGVAEGQAKIDALAAKTFATNGLFGSRAQLKTNYLQRDVGAMKGLYGNSLEEAWYGGYICDGSKPSMVHFTKDKLPPAKFFWSMTLYTLPDRFLYANPINRYSIGDRTKGLQYGNDGSLTIYVSNASPGKDKESNWLPAPAAKCSLVARVYGPSEAAMAGVWKLPPLS